MEAISPTAYWRATEDGTVGNYPSLHGDLLADVVIIGAGITGLTAAWHLKQLGKRVVVLEAGRVGAGTSGATSAHLEIVPDQGWGQLAKDFGDEAAREITQARQRAIEQIEQWTQYFSIACDLRRVPAYAYTERADRVERMEQEYDTALRLGVDVALLRHVADLPYRCAAALEVRQQGRFHAVKYLNGLARAVHGNNATIYEQTRAEPPEHGEPCIVRTARGTITANAVIVATHSAYLGVSQFDMRVSPYQSYVIAARVADQIPDALYFDDEEPYHYIRWAATNDPRLLLIGGADHKTGQGGDERQCYEQLRQYASERFRVLGIEHRWSAEYFVPNDGVPFIGPVPLQENLYVATGYDGTGLTYGTIAGQLLAEMVQGRTTSPLAEIFSPSRIKGLAAAQEFISENVNVAKHFVKDRFTPPAIDSIQEIPVGAGRVVRFQGEACAIYRRTADETHVLSPVCTHAGCYVHWNDAEKTWDCPCHGGRYAATGERIYGPPPADLELRPQIHEERAV